MLQDHRLHTKTHNFYFEGELSLFPAVDFLFSFHCTSWIMEQADALAQ